MIVVASSRATLARPSPGNLERGLVGRRVEHFSFRHVVIDRRLRVGRPASRLDLPDADAARIAVAVRSSPSGRRAGWRNHRDVNHVAPGGSASGWRRIARARPGVVAVRACARRRSGRAIREPQRRREPRAPLIVSRQSRRVSSAIRGRSLPSAEGRTITSPARARRRDLMERSWSSRVRGPRRSPQRRSRPCAIELAGIRRSRSRRHVAALGRARYRAAARGGHREAGPDCRSRYRYRAAAGGSSSGRDAPIHASRKSARRSMR